MIDSNSNNNTGTWVLMILVVFCLTAYEYDINTAIETLVGIGLMGALVLLCAWLVSLLVDAIKH